MEKKYILSTVILSVSLITAGYFWGNSYCNKKEREIVVKGLSEQIVKADSVEWTLGVKVTGNDFNVIDKKLDQISNAVKKLLTKKFSIDSVRVGLLEKTNRLTYYGGKDKPEEPYDLIRNFIVKTEKVDLIENAENEIVNIVHKMGSTVDPNNKKYNFNEISNIKPELLKKSVESADRMAKNLAKNLDLKLGIVKNATIDVSPKYRHEQESFPLISSKKDDNKEKKVEVESTVTFSVS